MDFAVELTSTPVGVILAVAGEVDLVSAPQLLAALRDALASGRPVVVDLGAVTFLDSSGLNVLIEAHKRAEELTTVMALRSVPPRIQKLLHITRLDEVLVVEREDPPG